MWQVDINWADEIFNQLNGEDWYDDTIYIAQQAQIKLLKYLTSDDFKFILTSDHMDSNMKEPLRKMLKEIEG